MAGSLFRFQGGSGEQPLVLHGNFQFAVCFLGLRLEFGIHGLRHFLVPAPFDLADFPRDAVFAFLPVPDILFVHPGLVIHPPLIGAFARRRVLVDLLEVAPDLAQLVPDLLVVGFVGGDGLKDVRGAGAFAHHAVARLAQVPHGIVASHRAQLARCLQLLDLPVVAGNAGFVFPRYTRTVPVVFVAATTPAASAAGAHAREHGLALVFVHGRAVLQGNGRHIGALILGCLGAWRSRFNRNRGRRKVAWRARRVAQGKQTFDVGLVGDRAVHELQRSDLVALQAFAVRGFPNG